MSATEILPQSRPRVSVEHIEIDAGGNAKLVGHGIKLKYLIGIMKAHGYTAETLQTEAYPHLSRSQIYAALAYYYDHQAEIDRQIAEDDEEFDRLSQQQQADPRYQELMSKIKSRAAAMGLVRHDHG